MQSDDDKTRTHVTLTGGTMVFHYRIFEKIGAGGMGEVYLAEDTALNRKVALKFLPQHLCQDPECRGRFTREAQAAAKLDHPNIVSVFEVGEFQGRPFFSMQHVEGQSLKEVIAGKALPLDRVIEIAIQVCDGLHAAHEKGITHRDVKPSNILIDSHGRARIVDFGLASVMGSDHLTKTGSTLGTIGYMSPEQVRGDKVDHRTDLFSFGVVLYEMITGHAPFKADSEAATLHAITSTKPELLARFRREVPPELQTVIDKALDKDVTTRYQHADELAADLRSVRKSSESTRGSRAQSTPSATKRRWAYFAAGLAILAIAFVLFKTYVLRPAEEPLDSLAVLPLQNLSSDPEQEYFSDGMTEALITELQKIKSLRVISRTSVMRFKTTNEPLPEIAKKLAVKAIVEGSVLRDGDNVRITVQLIQALPEKHLWASNFDRPMKGILAMQSDVARAIAQEVNAVVSPEEYKRLQQSAPVNPQAYQAYLKGRFYWNQRNNEAMQRAKAHFEEAIALDSNFAGAYTGLAAAYVLFPQYVNAPPWEYYVKADSVARIALRLDSSSAEAHAVIGSAKVSLWQWKDALAEYEKAIELDPRDATAHLWYGTTLRSLGRQEEGLAAITLAQRLDPLSFVINVNLGISLLLMRRDAEAVDQLQKTLELFPNHVFVHVFLGYVFETQGRLEEAISEYRTEVELTGGSYPAILSELGRAYALAGRTDDARRILDSLLKASQDKPYYAASIASVYYGLGDTVKTWEWIDRAVEQRYLGPLDDVKVNPIWRRLRQHSKYPALLRKMGLEP